MEQLHGMAMAMERSQVKPFQVAITLAIRASTPLAVLLDVIQPFPTFSEAVFQALRALDAQVNPPMPAAVTASTG